LSNGRKPIFTSLSLLRKSSGFFGCFLVIFKGIFDETFLIDCRHAMEQESVQNQKKLLVVDDEEHIRLLYKSELEDEGYQVILASDAREAVEIVDRESLDLIVLDIKMPGMDGIEAMQKIVGKKKSIPIIINSAYPHFRDSFMTWVAEEYVVKSSDLQELKNKIAQLLNKV
jgi:CheY-like chemotaxis protein